MAALDDSNEGLLMADYPTDHVQKVENIKMIKVCQHSFL
jgi:hypothetical protein